jgi:hypothetical protein
MQELLQWSYPQVLAGIVTVVAAKSCLGLEEHA